MYISNLHIDRFGIWTDLSFDIADGLNVVYGPNRSGKTTVVQFIRSMLYGFGSDVRNRYAPDDIGSVGGAVTIQGSAGRRVVRRYDNGDTLGHLTVQGGDGAVLGQRPLQGLLGNVPQSVFDRVFAPQFHDDAPIDWLIEHVLTHGFDAMGSAADTERLAQLKEQLQGSQRDLRELHPGGESFEQLTRRRRDLQQEIDSLKNAGADRRASVDRRLRKMDGELAEREEQLEELQQELRSLDAQIESREAERLRKEEEFRIARLDNQRARAGRREALRDIDAQLERWRRVLQDVEARGRQMRDTSELADTLEPDHAADPRRYLQQLESRIDEVQQILCDTGLAADADICQCRNWRSMFEPALREMREDVYRLCNEMSRWEKATTRTKHSSELGQLGRCESELRTAIAGLSQRRQRLLMEISQAGDVAGDLLTPVHSDLCVCNEHPKQIDNWPSGEEISAEQQEVLAHLSAEIQQLAARRQQVQSDLTTVEDELLDLQQRRRQLESEFGALDYGRRLDTLRLERQRVEEMLGHLERRQELLAAIGRLERDIQALETSLRHASVLSEASGLLRRLTEGELQGMSLTSQGLLLMHHRDGEPLRREQLSAAARDQVHLSLCLALAAAYGRRGTRLPLILNNTFTRFDASDVPAAARVIREFARDGQQVLLFTRHQHVADAFLAMDVVLRHLPRASQPPVEIKQAVRESVPTFGELSDAQRREVNQQLNVIADEMDGNAKVVEYAPCNAEEFPGELTDRVRPETQRESSASPTPLDDLNTSDYFLLATSPIQDAPSIDAATAERFRKIDVLFVRDLLQLDVHQAADRLRHAGISASMIRRWQSEALLTCCVPRLRPYDARILVGCGIDDADQLARIEAAELRRRVEQFAATSTGQVLLRAGNRYELSRLTDWIDAARRRQGQRSERRPSKRSSGESGRESEKQTDRHFGTRRWRERTEQHPSIAKRQTTASSANASASRHAKAQPVVLKMEQSDEPLRFYLSTDDPLEAAPSIGPRMAERFAEIGITTVAAFLEADPERLATRLDRRRVTSETIQSWQQQTTLACRIPWLRGHDAQILVACGITDVESLANMEAGELWLIVEPFIETKQCMRIVRNGTTPNFDEVYSWIQWARRARRLQAA